MSRITCTDQTACAEALRAIEPYVTTIVVLCVAVVVLWTIKDIHTSAEQE